MNTQIVVLDPGLMEAGGHHAAFAQSAVTAINALKNVDLTFYAHQSIDKKLVTLIKSNNCGLYTSFQTNFYKHFSDDANIAKLNGYISQLTKEYKTAIMNASAKAFKLNQQLCFFYPCVNWEHAAAINLALEMIASEQCVTSNIIYNPLHIVCAMYNPGIDHLGNTLCFRRRTAFNLAFRRLIKFNNVKLFTSDFELKQVYGQLLDRSVSLPIHPCYLINQQVINKMSPTNNAARTLNISPKPSRFFLYMGDAKENKGFNDLPELVRFNLNNLNDNITLVIHYTVSWEYPEILETIQVLDKIAKEDVRLELHKSFWSDNELLKQLSSATAMVFLYSNVEYANKSSGVLWLCSVLNLPVVFFSEHWLLREANRLNMDVFSLKNYNLLPVVNSLSSSELFRNTEKEKSNYYNSLFQPFWPWLFSIINTKT